MLTVVLAGAVELVLEGGGSREEKQKEVIQEGKDPSVDAQSA